MKKLIMGALASSVALAALPAMAQDLDPITFQLKWVNQGQFAGYLVAKDMGFYEEEGLDVTINPGGPDIAPEQVIAGGGADVITTWMAAGLAARERGVPLVNIAQPFARQALQLVCSEQSGVQSTEDFPGKKLGVWFFGNEYPFYAWMAKLGYSTEGGEGVEVLRQAFNVDPLLQNQADCISTMQYNEFKQLLDAGVPEDSLKVFNYADEGVGMLEDGLYVMQDRLDDPDFVDQMVRFVRASMRGWEYAKDNVDEAAGIVLENDLSGALTEDGQVWQVEVAAGLVGDTAALDPASYEQTVQTLLSAVSPDNPAITKEPEGATTTVVTDLLD
ncbi:MAG: ABC transporter substrate-binding protein [Aliihoeflea sp.]